MEGSCRFRLSLVDQKTGAPFTPRILAMKEGLNASIAVSQTPDGVRSFHVSGKTEASSSPGDMQLQRMLADLPALAHPRPRSILVVGFGAGITSGAFTLIPGVERIVICEIEPSIPQIIPQYFAKENYDLLNDRTSTCRFRRCTAFSSDDDGNLRHHYFRSYSSLG